MSRPASTTRIRPGVTTSNPDGNGTMHPRLDVKKTYKLYIGGSFPRSESGRYYKLTGQGGELIASACRASKKDFRDAVVAARKAQESWAARSAFNRGQVLYRIAETLEGRRAQFITTLILQGVETKQASVEVDWSVDTLVHYAGWCDKFAQVFSTVNPVESSHFNFSFPEPTGVVAALAPQGHGLAGPVSLLAPCIAGGNTMILLADRQMPLSALELAEVVHASDVPAGVVNLLTGFRDELAASFAGHMDVNAVVCCGSDPAELKTIQELAAGNVKRVVRYDAEGWMEADTLNPYRILDLQEIKTTWHPVGL